MAGTAIALGIGAASAIGGSIASAKGAKKGAAGVAARTEDQNLIRQKAADSVRAAGGDHQAYLEELAAQAKADIGRARNFQEGIAEDRQYLYHQLGDPRYYDSDNRYGSQVGDYGSIATSVGNVNVEDLGADLVRTETGKTDKRGKPIYQYALPSGQIVHEGGISGGSTRVRNPEYDPNYPKDGRNRGKRTEFITKGGGKKEPKTLMDLLSAEEQHQIELQGRLMSPAGQRVGRMTGIAEGLLRGAMGERDPIFQRFVEPTVTASAEQAAGLYRMAQAAWRNETAKGGSSAYRAMASTMQQMENARQTTALHMDNVRTAMQNLQVFAIGNAQSQEMFNQLWVSGTGQGTLSQEFSQISLALDTFWASNVMPMLAAGSQTAMQAEIAAAGIEAQMQTTAGQQEMLSAGLWSTAGGVLSKFGATTFSAGLGGLGGGSFGFGSQPDSSFRAPSKIGGAAGWGIAR